MQDRPSSAELVEAIADLLEGEVLAATSGGLKHRVRVAGNLCRILRREIELQPDNERRAAAAIAELLGSDAGTDATELNAQLARRIRENDDVELERAAWPVLVEIVCGKLAVDKPGHDAYDFESELAR